MIFAARRLVSSYSDQSKRRFHIWIFHLQSPDGS